MTLTPRLKRLLKGAAIVVTLAAFGFGVWWRNRPEPPEPGTAVFSASVLARVNGEDVTQDMVEQGKTELPAPDLQRFDSDPEGLLDWVIRERKPADLDPPRTGA